ncbi:MAG TPA: DedA family protein [Candidatus Methylacidiphilales bacterium]|jgi:undecaprenyl-diphosphatase|nr:DedA family protein [Candidatus Methylacidiphilales bacterium]
MHEHLFHFVGRMGHWGYLAIFVCVTLECSAIFFLPAETLVVIGGFFAARGELDLGDFIVVASIGAILGYCIGFDIGRKFGRPRLIHYGRWMGLDEKHFNRVDVFFTRYGGAAVFLGRFTSFMRAFVSLAAGSSNMPYRRFLFFNVTGGILWSAGFTLLGYFAGASWPLVEHLTGRASLIVILLLAVIGGLVWLRRKK